MSNLFWLSESQMTALPFPSQEPWRARVDDQRVLSGILFINRNGLPRCGAPGEYGPAKTLYNR